MHIRKTPGTGLGLGNSVSNQHGISQDILDQILNLATSYGFHHIAQNGNLSSESLTKETAHYGQAESIWYHFR